MCESDLIPVPIYLLDIKTSDHQPQQRHQIPFVQVN